MSEAAVKTVDFSEEAAAINSRSDLKRKLKREAAKLRLDLIGFADVGRWEKYHYNEPEFWPQNIWPWSRTVISIGVQILLPMLQTTPSVVYSECYNTTNRLLDNSAYQLAAFLNEKGFKATFFPRDCYGDISVLVKKPEAAFSQVLAAEYAGLGTVGLNHTLITPKYGPRVRWGCIITDAEIVPDRLPSKDYCIRCQKCVRACPQKAFTYKKGQIVAVMDKYKCAEYHAQLKSEFRYPCGVCTAVCPVGDDARKYAGNAVSAEGIEHCRNFGSKNAVENL